VAHTVKVNSFSSSPRICDSDKTKWRPRCH